MRTALVTALASCIGEKERETARRFLEGLSADELQYLAEYFGACILDGSRTAPQGMNASNRVRCCCDADHKVILLMEYLSRFRPVPRSMSAGHGA